MLSSFLALKMSSRAFFVFSASSNLKTCFVHNHQSPEQVMTKKEEEVSIGNNCKISLLKDLFHFMEGFFLAQGRLGLRSRQSDRFLPQCLRTCCWVAFENTHVTKTYYNNTQHARISVLLCLLIAADFDIEAFVQQNALKFCCSEREREREIRK